MEALKKLESNLHDLFCLLQPGLQGECKKSRYNNSLFEKFFQNICCIENIGCNLLERCSRYEMKHADMVSNNLMLKTELDRKDYLLRGLLFDLRLLQESTSNVKDMNLEGEEMVAAFSQVRQELLTKIAQVDDILIEQRRLEAQLAEREAALSSSRSEIEQVQRTLVTLSNENTKLKLLLEDAYIENTENEKLLEDRKNVIEGLETEILSINTSVEEKILTSVEEIMDELRRVSNERDQLQAELWYLNDKLDMASALAEENEAVAVEARQVAEVSKIYAEEKEEEIKVLERSVEELDDTINILEKKVFDMKQEMERYQLIRKGLELEVQALTQRIMTVENAAENLIAEYSNVEAEKCLILRRLDDKIMELCEAKERIEDLEMEKTYSEEEIKQYREHIAELVLHSEAQSSLYQEKFKALEAMVSEVKPDTGASSPASSTGNKIEKISSRTRGSGSPFRCISTLVQQVSSENAQELSAARLRIEELEALAAARQKEVLMLNTRLAAVDSMAHDVIRDLMGVKLDMTNYANLIDQEQLQKLLEKSHQQTEESNAKENEILTLKKQIQCLIEERDSWLEEINQRKADILASSVMVERLQQRDQLLTAQNEMSKMDKANLHRKIAELDDKENTIPRIEVRSIGESNLRYIRSHLKRGNSSLHLTQQQRKTETTGDRFSCALSSKCHCNFLMYQ